MRRKEKQTNPRSVFLKNVSPLFWLIKPKTFFFIGILFLFLYGLLNFHSATRLSFSSTETIIDGEFSDSSEIPSQISIPALSLTLPTFEAAITNGIWQIHEHGVSHLSSSQNPGENGNGIFYAHNTDKLFGKLNRVQKGDLITVMTKDQAIYSYRVTDILIVNPTDINVLTDHQGEMITLYTCTGFADLKRLVVKAKRLDTFSRTLIK